MISKKKLAALTVAGMLGLGVMVSGITYALFTDTTTNANNNFTAGTINLVAERNYGDYLPGPIFYPDTLDPDGGHPYDVNDANPSGEALGGWAPGDTVSREMRLKNEGTLDARLTGIKATPRVSFSHNTPYSGTRTVNGGLISGMAYDEFIQKINVKVSNGSVLLYDGPLSGLIFADPDTYAPLVNEPIVQAPPPGFGGGFLNIDFEVTLDLSGSNELQGKNFIFDLGFYTEQVRNNP